MTSTNTPASPHTRRPNTVAAACANHPNRPGVWLFPDGTFRCHACHDEPRVVGWEPTTAGDVCLYCHEPVRGGARIAVLDTCPPQRVCEDCTDGA